ncbi:hypothetical protein EDB80DRAFT_200063 [Ilyonectria destructans]|nr:hypothetical protein EDB80DRAFT_200063 [Ilyonectria destructans]
MPVRTLEVILATIITVLGLEVCRLQSVAHVQNRKPDHVTQPAHPLAKVWNNTLAHDRGSLSCWGVGVQGGSKFSHSLSVCEVLAPSFLTCFPTDRHVLSGPASAN